MIWDSAYLGFHAADKLRERRFTTFPPVYLFPHISMRGRIESCDSVSYDPIDGITNQ